MLTISLLREKGLAWLTRTAESTVPVPGHSLCSLDKVPGLTVYCAEPTFESIAIKSLNPVLLLP